MTMRQPLYQHLDPLDPPDRLPTPPAVPGKYLSLTSFRRDGTGVATPVWFVETGGRLLVETDAASYVDLLFIKPFRALQRALRRRPRETPVILELTSS
jgi:hypothetical protein